MGKLSPKEKEMPAYKKEIKSYKNSERNEE